MATHPLHSIGITSHDLAPGDRRFADFDWTGLGVHFVTSPADPWFDRGFAALWTDFGDKGEMETRDVIAHRLTWRTKRTTARGYALQYDMAVVHAGDAVAAVVDHSAIVDLNRPEQPAVVHVSHLWVAPPHRRTGLAGWLRALPLATARQCLALHAQLPRMVTLVGEMEPADPADPASVRRTTAFEKAGFRKVDPRRVNYLQPDFRPPAVIDADGGPTALALSLVVRRVGREDETSVAGAEIRAMVEAVYSMYEQSFRPSDMSPNWKSLAAYPAEETAIDLLPPSSPPVPSLAFPGQD